MRDDIEIASSCVFRSAIWFGFTLLAFQVNSYKTLNVNKSVAVPKCTTHKKFVIEKSYSIKVIPPSLVQFWVIKFILCKTLIGGLTMLLSECYANILVIFFFFFFKYGFRWPVLSLTVNHGILQ